MTLPKTHQALIQRAKGAELKVESIDTYTPKKGEVLVRIEAAGLNPADWKVRDYGFSIGNYPLVLGLDGAGVIVALGEGVTNLEAGDRVYVYHLFTRHNIH